MRISDWSSDVFASDLLVVITRKLGEGDRGVLPGEVLEAGAANLEGLAALLGADDVGHEALARGLAVVAPAFGHGLAVHDGVNARDVADDKAGVRVRSEEHTSELQSLMRISYAVFCLKKKQKNQRS